MSRQVYFNMLCKLFLLVIFVVSGCISKINSKLNVDAGFHIISEQKNTVPGVVSINNICTATAVSSSTLITAAHCIGSKKKVCVTSGLDAIGKCSTDVFVPMNYEFKNWQKDIAVAVFKVGTFKHYFGVATKPVQRNDHVLMIGYSKYSNDDPRKGSKRWGANIVSQIITGDVIVSNYRGHGHGVSLSPGDSGGALFRDCKLVGVASRVNSILSSRGKKTLHTNVTSRAVLSWLDSLQSKAGAVYCGWTNQNHELCNPQRIAQPLEQPLEQLIEQNEFPCHPGRDYLPIEPVYVAVGPEPNIPTMALSVPATTKEVYFCSVQHDQDDPCDEARDLLLAQYHSPRNGRKIFSSVHVRDISYSGIYTIRAVDEHNKTVALSAVEVQIMPWLNVAPFVRINPNESWIKHWNGLVFLNLSRFVVIERIDP